MVKGILRLNCSRKYLLSCSLSLEVDAYVFLLFFFLTIIEQSIDVILYGIREMNFINLSNIKFF